jgi:hypothetical protein
MTALAVMTSQITVQTFNFPCMQYDTCMEYSTTAYNTRVEYLDLNEMYWNRKLYPSKYSRMNIEKGAQLSSNINTNNSLEKWLHEI